MELRTLGGTGIRVSRYCLGAMMFGAMGNTDHDACARIVHRALDAGINFIDTADAYSRGESETILAKAIAGKRQDLVLASKCFFPTGGDVNEGGGSRRWIVRAVEESLRRLGTDHLDLFQLHRRDYETDLEESLSALSDLLREGKVRAIGMSATPAWMIVEGQWVSERRQLARVRSEQCLYSLLARGVEAQVLPTCARYGLGVMVYAPLGGGWLTGKYRRGEAAPEGSRGASGWAGSGRWDETRPEVQRKYDLVAALDGLAKAHGHSLIHMALAFASEHPAVSSAIIGPRTLEQMEGLVGGFELDLAPETLDAIDEIVAPGSDIDARDTTAPSPGFAVAARRRVR